MGNEWILFPIMKYWSSQNNHANTAAWETFRFEPPLGSFYRKFSVFNYLLYIKVDSVPLPFCWNICRFISRWLLLTRVYTMSGKKEITSMKLMIRLLPIWKQRWWFFSFLISIFFYKVIMFINYYILILWLKYVRILSDMLTGRWTVKIDFCT